VAVATADRGSNTNDLIVNAARLIRRSKHNRKVFVEIYRGKKQIKTVESLMSKTGLSRNRVLDAGARFVANDIVERVKEPGLTGYRKVAFYQSYRNRIIAASKPGGLERIPTKVSPARRASRSRTVVKVSVPLQRRFVDTRRITIDDVDAFSKVRKIREYPASYTAIRETAFKHGVAGLLGEKGGRFRDWGGERSDLSTTKLRLDGKRVRAAFAFKGLGTTGKLTPGKMGRNGDQIQRLMRCPADLFFVQYWAEIDDYVVEQLEQLAQLKSLLESRRIWYGVIDGDDSNALMLAYPRAFPGVRIK
jgi:hypothetical protein